MTFDPRSTRRIADSTRYTERIPRYVPRTQRRYPIGDDTSIQKAFVTTTITARTGNPPGAITPGTGVVTLYTWNGTTWVAGETGISVKNPYTVGFAVNKMVVVTIGEAGWEVLGGDC